MAEIRMPPPYGRREGFVPKTDADYNDGGAYPEVHVAQYPHEIGRKKRNAIKQMGTKAFHASSGAVARVPGGNAALAPNLHETLRQDSETIEKTTSKTKAALEKIINGKISANSQSTVDKSALASSQLIRYIPANPNGETNGRIVKMTEMPVDPMDPPKHRHKKIPRGPGSPPAAVMHSPPRKITAQQQREWVIPPCVSNWKNKKGFAIALDKRLAADGRGLVEHVINDKFASFAEAMYTADRLAREETYQRSKMEQALLQKEKLEKEENLRLLAQRARDERQTLNAEAAAEDDDEEGGYQEREEVRRDRERQRQREMRMSHMGTEARSKFLSRMADRDVTEKIALGMSSSKGEGAAGGEFDQRLFNQSEGIGRSFGADDTYNVYDKPLFASGRSAAIYNPTNLDASGARGMGSGGGGGNGGETEFVSGKPVQFEKANGADVFGMDNFLKEAKESARARGGEAGGRAPEDDRRQRDTRGEDGNAGSRRRERDDNDDSDDGGGRHRRDDHKRSRGRYD